MLANIRKNYDQTDFGNGITNSPKFLQFSKDFVKELRKEAKKYGFKVIGFKPNHFDMSGFLENLKTGKFVYISIGDVRYSRNWLDRVLIRTVESSKDYTGKRNQYTELEDIVAMAEEMTA